MTTLLQSCRNLDAKLADLALAKLELEDVRLIQVRSEEWGARKAKLMGIDSRARLLSLAAADETTVSAKRKLVRQHAATVLARLESRKDIKELTRDAAWTRLLSAVDGLAEEVDLAGRSAWRVYREQLGTLEDPETLRLRTPPTPQNEEALSRYRASHAAYASIAHRALPTTPDDLAQVAAHVVACKSAYGQITFDLPAEVGRFFDALQSDAATMGHVTPQVLAWLAERGQLDRFRVRAARQ
jgi:hypothetical protein